MRAKTFNFLPASLAFQKLHITSKEKKINKIIPFICMEF
jgi:hypothetical protein